MYIDCKSFKIPIEINPAAKHLTDEQLGKIFRTLLAYVNDEEADELPRQLIAFWIPIRNYIDANNLLFADTSVYLIKLESDKEKFLKIGISSEIKKRFKRFESYGYSVELIKLIKCRNRTEANNLEYKLLNSVSDFEYTPKIDFEGKTECFYLEALKNKRIQNV